MPAQDSLAGPGAWQRGPEELAGELAEALAGGLAALERLFGVALPAPDPGGLAEALVAPGADDPDRFHMRVTQALFPGFLHARDGWEGLARRQAGLLPDGPAVAAICAEAAALFARPEGELVARAAALIEMVEHDAASLAAVGGAHAHARENHGFWESFTHTGLRAAGSPRLEDFLGRRLPWLESFAPVTARFRACGFPELHFAALRRLAAAAGTPAPVTAAGQVALEGQGVSTGVGLFNGDVEFAGTLAQPLGPVPRGALPGLLACLGAVFPAAGRIRLADGGATRRFLLEGRLEAFVAAATQDAEAVVFVVPPHLGRIALAGEGPRQYRLTVPGGWVHELWPAVLAVLLGRAEAIRGRRRPRSG
jgi:hypothetical protein